jgi:magnesium transporter
MIKVYKHTKRGVVEGSLNDLGKKEVCWADCIKPSKTELQEISDITKISLSDLKDSFGEEERPKVLDLEKYSLITFRAPFFEHHETHIATCSIAIFISKNKNNLITIRTREIASIERLEQRLLKKNTLLQKGTTFLLYRLLDEILNSYFQILDTIEDKIDQIEDDVIDRPERSTVERIFSIKKTLIFFHKALTANREVITSIEKEYVKEIDKKNIKRFRSLYNDITQLIDTEATYRDITTGTLDIYLGSVSYNLNQVMKTLTVVASFVLVPTLISGIYGMNFVFMPEIHSELGQKYGYYFALGLMAFSVLGMYIFFKRKRWI